MAWALTDSFFRVHNQFNNQDCKLFLGINDYQIALGRTLPKLLGPVICYIGLTRSRLGLSFDACSTLDLRLYLALAFKTQELKARGLSPLELLQALREKKVFPKVAANRIILIWLKVWRCGFICRVKRVLPIFIQQWDLADVMRTTLLVGVAQIEPQRTQTFRQDKHGRLLQAYKALQVK